MTGSLPRESFAMGRPLSPLLLPLFLPALLTLAPSTHAAQPLYPYIAHQPVYPVQAPPPSYIVYPHAVYRLSNGTEINRHDFVFGMRAPQDRLLLHTVVYKRPGIWSSYASKEITFPPPGNHMRVNITQVNAYDRGKNNTGGFVKMVGGGIGRENVTLLFRSQKNKPINFELDIFGKHRP